MVKWNDLHEKKALFRLVRNLLVARENEKLFVKPLKQQLWIDYPVPEKFRIYWCDEVDELVLEKRSGDKCGGEGASGGSSRDAELELKLIVCSLENLRKEFRYLREPTLNEVAVSSGCSDPELTKKGLELGHWKDESLEEAKKVAEEAINLAGCMRLKEKADRPDYTYAGRMETIDLHSQVYDFCNEYLNHALRNAVKLTWIIRQEYPKLAPKVTLFGFKWPEETQNKWRQVFGCDPPSSQFSWKLQGIGNSFF